MNSNKNLINRNISVGIYYLHASRITMQKESTNLDQRFKRYGLRKFEFKFGKCKHVKFWLYSILLVTTSTQEKESMNLELRISKYT